MVLNCTSIMLYQVILCCLFVYQTNIKICFTTSMKIISRTKWYYITSRRLMLHCIILFSLSYIILVYLGKCIYIYTYLFTHFFLHIPVRLRLMSDLNTVKKFCHLGGVLSYLQKIHEYRTDTIHKIYSTFRYIYIYIIQIVLRIKHVF